MIDELTRDWAIWKARALLTFDGVLAAELARGFNMMTGLQHHLQTCDICIVRNRGAWSLDCAEHDRAMRTSPNACWSGQIVPKPK